MSNNLRQVKVNVSGKPVPGYFHQWGTDSANGENGVHVWTVGIVELSDGKVVKVQPQDVQFITLKELLSEWGLSKLSEEDQKKFGIIL